MLILILLLFLFSLIQSIFGVGLLLFGTPTFILMGHSFPETLALVLPPSVLISTIQVIHGKGSSTFNFKKSSLVILIISTVVSLYFILGQSLPKSFNLILGTALLLSLILKIFPPLQKILTFMINRAEPIYMLVMGVIQGISNLGGGFLTLFAVQKSQDKYQAQYIIALTYLVWGILQLITIYGLGAPINYTQLIVSLVIARLSYFLANRYLMGKISDRWFQQILLVIIFLYSLVMFINYFLND